MFLESLPPPHVHFPLLEVPLDMSKTHTNTAQIEVNGRVGEYIFHTLYRKRTGEVNTIKGNQVCLLQKESLNSKNTMSLLITNMKLKILSLNVPFVRCLIEAPCKEQVYYDTIQVGIV